MKGNQRLFRNNNRLEERSVDLNGNSYSNIKDYYLGVVRQMPVDENGLVYGAEHHSRVLMYLSFTGVWEVCSDDAVYIDDWNLSSPELTHRHRELGVRLSSYDNKHYSSEFDVQQGKCVLCGEEVPGEYVMVHNFYRLDD